MYQILVLTMLDTDVCLSSIFGIIRDIFLGKYTTILRSRSRSLLMMKPASLAEIVMQIWLPGWQQLSISAGWQSRPSLSSRK